GTWHFEDAIEDDGHGHTELVIRCEMTIEGDRLMFDLRDAHPQVEGPVNVPRAVTLSAALYVVQCLAPSDIPSNGGVMRPLEVLTSPGTLVDAVYPAAVAAGNVETSQRITDVLIGALSKAVPDLAPAASAGTMNNLLVGGVDTRGEQAKPFAYYETIGGGSGASAGQDGASAIQTHMTNTLNTPIEALEHAYPMTMMRYRVRRGSGGAGKWRGGDGVERGYRADVPMTVTLMTERRVTRPYGLEGGEDGAVGENLLISKDQQETRLPAKHTLELEPGDVVLLRTPGGGGFGNPE
ncbi:MAG: hydantoinase B/oxoprolinase family protein, partial [Myxococcota bacterium]|nr:hydantoinase B/oxoprolinase family protein [Myxococcota bacterium]